MSGTLEQMAALDAQPPRPRGPWTGRSTSGWGIDNDPMARVCCNSMLRVYARMKQLQRALILLTCMAGCETAPACRFNCMACLNTTNSFVPPAALQAEATCLFSTCAVLQRHAET
jgi:hypothetical protein